MSSRTHVWGLQIPNPLFDLAGITCGHFLVPFWTFFGATLIGKAVIKMHIQVGSSLCHAPPQGSGRGHRHGCVSPPFHIKKSGVGRLSQWKQLSEAQKRWESCGDPG